ncbi:hypothetical protein R1sor_004559 [Riccia sorocarpa]|uniref:Uncharacterized protein n=1 Tax=Riccia sorocarpa TaxID=122646 RepID=A0ABD3HHL4_9MARC
MVQSVNEIPQEDDESMGQIRAVHICLHLALPSAVKALIELGVPDALTEAGLHVELTAAEIASRCTERAADPESFDRLLRLLASHNFLRVSVNSENPDQRKYALTTAGGLQYLVKNNKKSELDARVYVAFRSNGWTLLEKYKGLEGLGSLIDVGGGTGETLALILSKYPQLRGINFDQPHVVAKGVQVPGEYPGLSTSIKM